MIYLFVLFFLFFHCLNSNEFIEFNPDNSFEEIKTKYGIIIYEKHSVSELNTDRSPDVKYYFRISNLKNTSNINFSELRKKYAKYKVSIILDQPEKIKINFIENNKKICYLILTEILYITGYINKNICVYENNKRIIYLGGNDFINKKLRKFTFYENDTFTQIIANNSIYNISQSINIIDVLSLSNFNLIIDKILSGNNNNYYYFGSDCIHFKGSKYEISFKLQNKMINLGVVNSNQIALSFLDYFIFREYDLDKNEYTFYLDSYKYKNDIVTDINNQAIYKTSNISIMIYLFIILSISYAIINRNIKNKNEEYPIYISDVY